MTSHRVTKRRREDHPSPAGTGSDLRRSKHAKITATGPHVPHTSLSGGHDDAEGTPAFTLDGMEAMAVARVIDAQGAPFDATVRNDLEPELRGTGDCEMAMAEKSRSAAESSRCFLGDINQIMRVPPSAEGPYCHMPGCRKAFRNESNLRRHNRRMHGGEKMHTCSVSGCSKSFSTESELNRHNQQVHVQQRTHTCGVCDKSFFLKWDLKRHNQQVHGQQRPFGCDTDGCRKAFRNESNLRRHNRRMHGGEKMHTCSVSGCSKSFSTERELNRHNQQVHVQQRTHTCGVCDKSFFLKWGLKRHNQQVHGQQRPFGCDTDGCRKAFVRMCDLAAHRQQVHKTERSVHERQGLFECGVPGCGGAFAEEPLLQNHMRAEHPDCTEGSGSPKSAVLVSSGPDVVDGHPATGTSPIASEPHRSLPVSLTATFSDDLPARATQPPDRQSRSGDTVTNKPRLSRRDNEDGVSAAILRLLYAVADRGTRREMPGTTRHT